MCVDGVPVRVRERGTAADSVAPLGCWLVRWLVRFFIRSFVRPSVRSLARLLGSDYSPTRRRYKITASGRMKLVIFFTAYLVLGIFGTVYSTFGTSTTDAQLYQPCVRTPALTECIPLAINRR